MQCTCTLVYALYMYLYSYITYTFLRKLEARVFDKLICFKTSSGATVRYVTQMTLLTAGRKQL